MPNEIRVLGLKELRKALKDAPKEIKKMMKDGGKQAANIVADQAKIEVPVRTGRLRNSIKATSTGDKASVKAGTAARVPYAGTIHFGWQRVPDTGRYKARGWRGGPIRPQPFIYEAMDKRAADVVAAYERFLDEFINQIGTD